MTRAGFERLREELERLKKVDRLAISRAIAEARAHGDLSENAEYHAAREKQAMTEARIKDLEAKLGTYDGTLLHYPAERRLLGITPERLRRIPSQSSGSRSGPTRPRPSSGRPGPGWSASWSPTRARPARWPTCWTSRVPGQPAGSVVTQPRLWPRVT